MEKYIKTILKYDADNATEYDRKILIDAVMELFLIIIAKDKRFKKLEKIGYTFSDNVRGGSYGVSGLKLNSGIFGYGGEHYLNDLSVLFHELFHYAQDNLVDQSALAKSDSRMICVSTHFYSLILFILNREYPEYMQYANIFGLNAVFGMNENLNTIRNYFHSYYELQSFEVEANNFSIEALKIFVREAEKLNLTDKEKAVLMQYKALIDNLIKSFSNYIDKLKCMRQNPKTRGKIEKSVQGVVGNVFELMPNLFEYDKIVPDSDHAALLVLLGQSLEINYDDKLAHQLFDYLIKKDNDEFRDNELLHLGIWTEIEFSEIEKDQFKAFVESSSYVGPLDFCVLMKEKERIINERRETSGFVPKKQKS